MPIADMHIHSVFSDGTLTPAEIVETARQTGVGLLSVCDHNEVRGTLESAALARAAGLAYVPGVEIDAIFQGVDVHILCYGANLEDEALLSRIRHARAALDHMSDELVRRMLPDYPSLSEAEFAAWEHDPSRGGWKLLQYLQDKGVTGSLTGALPMYGRYGVTYEKAGFDGAEAVVQAIHKAGGRAVLAHPGEVFSKGDLSALSAQVEAALELGMDGVECYYPRHGRALTEACLAICRERGAMITAGSDCHGAFNDQVIGQTGTEIRDLALKGLLPEA